MNEYNHHRIIERVASRIQQDSKDSGIHLNDTKKQILKNASDFTDFFLSSIESAKNKYFFYLYNYDITIEGTNTIKLNRITKNDYDLGIRKLKWNNSIRCMEKSGEKLLDGSYSLDGWNSNNDEKEFFSSVNDRKRSPNELELTYSSILKLLVGRPEGCLKELDETFDNLLDTANQSDNVAFLHAMGAIDENKNDSRKEFEKHLKKCFSEYLFLENEEDALFMLGIAFHGIMDSFTPSHMDFQKYTEQDMGLHSQGDVIPITGLYNNKDELIKNTDEIEEILFFDPGQYKKENVFVQQLFRRIKYYDDDNFLNPVEYEMLRIFFHISNLQVKYGNNWEDVRNLKKFWQSFSFRGDTNTLKQVNGIIGNERRYRYRYGPKSYAYSEAAIRVISEIYMLLRDEREKCKRYDYYKNNKVRIVDVALDVWINVYDGNKCIEYTVIYCEPKVINGDRVRIPIGEEKISLYMNVMRENHIGLSLYSKNPDLEKWKKRNF